MQVRATNTVANVPQSATTEAAEPMPLGGFIPPQNKIVVDSLEKLQLAEEVLFGDGRGGPKVVGAAAHLRLVGLDCEWRPFENNQTPNPVAVFQVVTRTHAFLLDMPYWCTPWGGNPPPSTESDPTEASMPDVARLYAELNEKEAVMNAFITKLFSANKPVTLVAFQFGYDMHRLATSYPQLPVFYNRCYTVEKVLEVVKLARKSSSKIASKRRALPLKELHSLVLKRPMSKEQQCSDWAQRPLTQAQVDYASADGLCVVQMVDTICTAQSKMLMDLATYTTMPHIPRSERFRSKKGGLSLPSGHRASLLATRPLSGRKAIVCAPVEVELDLAEILPAQLGQSAPVVGQPAVMKMVAHASNIKFPKNSDGVVVWKNAVLVFATIEKKKLGKSPIAILTDNGTQLTLRKTVPSGKGPVLLFLRLPKSPYVCCGTLTCPPEAGGVQDQWLLDQFEALSANGQFQSMVKINQ